MSQLIPCPSCGRHVRRTESACPFCAASVSFEHVPARPMPSARLGRAAIFAFGATVATVGAGCGGGTSGGTDAYIGMLDAAYGGPPLDAGTDADIGMLDAAYGGPPLDAGNDGGPGPLYGAPSDAGAQDDTGGGAALYGAAPADGG